MVNSSSLPPLPGFIFDMDGTMIDNMRFHTEAWTRLLAESTLEVDVEEFLRRSSGKPTHELLEEMFGEQMPETERRKFAERKEILYRDIYRPHLKAIPGLARFLEESQQQGIPLALASSARQRNIEFVLRGLGMEGIFQTVISAADVKRGKPDPEMFLTAAAQLQREPKDCIVFEDALAGIEAARLAGMRTVVITTLLSEAEALSFPHVLRALQDYTALHPSALIHTLRQGTPE
jgi:beta-phosphoglucomutase